MTRRLLPRLPWLAFAAACAAQAATAQEILSAEAFDAYVTGTTVTYAHDGHIYGVEQYLPDRQVIWREVGGTCQKGVWFEQDGHICFSYGPDLPLQCWQFFSTGSTLGARVAGDPEGLWLYEVEQRDAPLDCPQPFLGS